jgi:hypothetical protein
MNSVLLKSIVAVCGLTWLGLLVMAGTVEVSRALWLPFGSVVTLAGLVVWLFEKFLWRWPPFTWVARRADLRGTWRGELVSEWIDPKTGTTLPPIPAFMCVTQTASTLYLRQFTGESSSATVAASIVKDADGAESVAVVYRNDPKGSVRERSPIHFGGMRLHISGEAALAGDYWTDRNTRGHLTLERVSRKPCRSLTEAQERAREIATARSKGRQKKKSVRT